MRTNVTRADLAALKERCLPLIEQGCSYYEIAENLNTDRFLLDKMRFDEWTFRMVSYYLLQRCGIRRRARTAGGRRKRANFRKFIGEPKARVGRPRKESKPSTSLIEDILTSNISKDNAIKILSMMIKE